MVLAKEIREIDTGRRLAGMPHVWGVQSALHAICRLPGDEELHLVGVGPPGTWVLRRGDPQHGEDLMEVEGTDLYGAMGTAEFLHLALHPNRLVRAVRMLSNQGNAEVDAAPAGQSDDVWEVPSATHPDVVYSVDIEQDTCTCPDNRYRHRRCKHILAVALLHGDGCAGREAQ